MNELDPYFLGYRREEQERLERQAPGLAAYSARLFDQVGLREGSRAAEIGCGPRGCLELLSERVGATGKVIGVERSSDEVQRARQHIVQARLNNTEVLQADARATGLPPESFDLATARLVLVNVPAPGQIVAEMVRLVRPGGVVALHEADSISQVCDPPLPAWTRLSQLLTTYAQMNGIDRFIGRRIGRMLREAGLAGIHVHPLIQVFPPRHERRTILPDFAENSRDRILDRNLIGVDELNELTGALKRHLEDPNTLVLSTIHVQAWGRKVDR
ncbi:MAG: methyltransferase domain-containing protein [Burkholderiales bacterium]